jgi:hypothetical protein
LLFFSDDRCDTFEGRTTVFTGQQELIVPGKGVACDEAIDCLARGRKTGRSSLVVVAIVVAPPVVMTQMLPILRAYSPTARKWE